MFSFNIKDFLRIKNEASYEYGMNNGLLAVCLKHTKCLKGCSEQGKR